VSTVLVVSLAVVAAWVLAGALVLLLRRLRARGRRDLDVALAGAPVLLEEPGANFAGLASRGGRQVRGNGALALTEDALVFQQWVPRRVLRIPRRDIVAVDRTRGHAGKWGPRMIRVTFTSPEGRTDSAAWWVHDEAAWLAALDAPTPPR
jgi:hypothetical protein